MRKALARFPNDDGAPALLSLLRDGGLEVLDSIVPEGDEVIAVLAGEPLPAECECDGLPRFYHLKVVQVRFEKISYGAQSITKISSIEVTGATLANLAPGFFT